MVYKKVGVKGKQNTHTLLQVQSKLLTRQCYFGTSSHAPKMKFSNDMHTSLFHISKLPNIMFFPQTPASKHNKRMKTPTFGFWQ